MASLRIGIYSANGSLPAAVALGKGFAAVGYAVNHRSLSDFGHNDRESIFSLIAVFGLRGKGATILKDYRGIEVPVLVVDFGYLKRPDYWQVSLNGLGCLPPFACPADRFEALGLPIQPMHLDGPTVLCGQLVGDAAHPFDTEKKLNAFVAQYPDLEYRPHPLNGEAEIPLEPIDAFLARVGKIVTWNSNIGNDAWLAGVPVEALAPDAMYKDVTAEARAAYFARVAYGQWTEQEMSDGTAAAFVVNHFLTGAGRPVLSERPTVLTQEVEVKSIRNVTFPGIAVDVPPVAKPPLAPRRGRR